MGSDKRRRWPVPVVGVVILVVLLFFVLIRPQDTPSTVASLPKDYEELLALLQANEVQLPLISANGNQQVIFTDQSGMNGYIPQHFSHFPYIVEEQIKYRIGDYVMLKENKLYSAVQIVGVGGDQVEVREQQVYINHQALTLLGMMALNLEWEEDWSDVLKKLSWYVESSSMHPFNPFSPTSFTVKRDEIAVKEDRQIEAKGLVDVVGKIVAIQEIQPTLSLTKEEQIWYSDFKKHGLKALKDASPMNVLKIYVKTMLEQEIDLNYLLTSQNENYHQWTLEEHRQIFTMEFLSKEQYQQLLTYHYNGVEQGFLSEQVTGEIQLVYEATNKQRLVMKLRPNKDGIW